MNIDDRMKAYEQATRYKLPIRMPVVIRLDGKAFHTLTRNCDRPFDIRLRNSMVAAVHSMLDEIPARMAYHQSDEVSLLLIDYNKFESRQWFDGCIQKMASVSASIMGVEFSQKWGSSGYFDSRVFPIPERDVENHFIWRQQDCMRNAISMAAQAKFSAKELHGINSSKKLEMLANVGVDFNAYPTWFRQGTVITRGSDLSSLLYNDGQNGAPVFTTNKDYFKQFLTVEEE